MSWKGIGSAIGGLLGSLVAPGVGTAVGAGLGGALGGLGDSDGTVSQEELERRRREKEMHDLATAKLDLSAGALPASAPAPTVQPAIPSSANAVGNNYIDYGDLALRKYAQGGY